MKTDSPPDTKSAEQSDEDVSGQENLRKDRERLSVKDKIHII